MWLSGTGFDRPAFHCYLLLKVVIGSIPLFLKWDEMVVLKSLCCCWESNLCPQLSTATTMPLRHHSCPPWLCPSPLNPRESFSNRNVQWWQMKQCFLIFRSNWKKSQWAKNMACAKKVFGRLRISVFFTFSVQKKNWSAFQKTYFCKRYFYFLRFCKKLRLCLCSQCYKQFIFYGFSPKDQSQILTLVLAFID